MVLAGSEINNADLVGGEDVRKTLVCVSMKNQS